VNRHVFSSYVKYGVGQKMLGAVFGFPCVACISADIPGPIREFPNSVWNFPSSIRDFPDSFGDFPAFIQEFPSSTRELPNSICAIHYCLWEASSTIIGSKRGFIQAHLLGTTPYFQSFAVPR